MIKYNDTIIDLENVSITYDLYEMTYITDKTI